MSISKNLPRSQAVMENGRRIYKSFLAHEGYEVPAFFNEVNILQIEDGVNLASGFRRVLLIKINSILTCCSSIFLYIRNRKRMFNA